MSEYRDPENRYTVEYPEGWLPLTHEGSPHVSLASLATGGYLRIEAQSVENTQLPDAKPEETLKAFIRCEQRSHKGLSDPALETNHANGARVACTSFTRREPPGDDNAADFGHTRAWVFLRGNVQVRCLYRCRSDDRGEDDNDLSGIIRSMMITDKQVLDAQSFTRYYFSRLKLHRPQLAINPPEGLSLTLADGQTILLEHLYNHYLLEPERMDDLIESHLQRLDYCGDDVPDLTNYGAIRELLFPKIFRVRGHSQLPAYRLPSWPGLAVGAIVQGRVFTYGVNSERLKHWKVHSLHDLMKDLTDNLYSIPPVTPRGLRNKDGKTTAISYLDHPLAASFIMFEDFFETTSHNLGVDEFLVGLPDPGCVSCFRDDDPRFVVQHTALLRWDYHRSVERLTDTIYLVTGPSPADVQPYDVLHCCPKKA